MRYRKRQKLSSAVVAIILLMLACAGQAHAQAQTQEEAESTFRQANGFFDEERWTEALSMYEQVLVLDPDYHRAHWYRARCLQELGRLVEALEEARRYRRVALLEAEVTDADALLKQLEEALVSSPEARRIRRKHMQRRDGPALLSAGLISAGVGGILTGISAGRARNLEPGSSKREGNTLLFGVGVGLGVSGGVLSVLGLGLTIELSTQSIGLSVGGRLP